ncbi:hypothetical protein FAM18121_02126 [Lacticaseibacillus paracasei]|nr:hypothetical protein FAM18121_02126 [Lacticaseibacillus paracasei]
MEILTDYMPWIIAAIVLILIFIFLATHRKTALPNEVLIISGAMISGKHSFRDVNGNRVKLITNGGSFILPILQRWDVLSLNTRTNEVATPEVYTQQGVPIIVNGTVILKIGSSQEGSRRRQNNFWARMTNKSIRKQPKSLKAICALF